MSDAAINVNLDFAKIALAAQAATIRDSVKARGPHRATIPCPGLGDLTAAIKSESGHTVVEVTKVGDKPYSFVARFADDDQVMLSSINLEPELIPGKDLDPPPERKVQLTIAPSIPKTENSGWELIKDGRKDEKELKRRTRDGKEEWQSVDTTIYCYKMKCACGAYRYAKPQDIKQVKSCRACTVADRRTRHAARQKNRRLRAVPVDSAE